VDTRGNNEPLIKVHTEVVYCPQMYTHVRVKKSEDVAMSMREKTVGEQRELDEMATTRRHRCGEIDAHDENPLKKLKS